MKLDGTAIHERKIRSSLKMFHGRPDLTPMVDVFFILLLFFLLSSSFIQISGVQVELPRSDGSYTSGILERHIITVAWSPRGNLIYFNNKQVTLDTLKAELAGLGLNHPNAGIVIYCDRRVPYGDAFEIESLALRANLPVIRASMPRPGTRQTVFQ